MNKNSSKMYSAFVIGSNGAVGRALVKELLSSNLCGKVTAMARKQLTESDFDTTKNDKFESKVINFDALDENSFQGYDVGFNALGSTIKKAGSQEAFYKIDFTYPTTIAKMAQKNGTKFFGSVSSMGADTGSSFFYPKTKGEIDEAFNALKFEKCSIFRPGLLMTPREESRPGEYFAQSVMAWINFAFVGPLKNYQAISVEAVARAIRLDFEKYWIEGNEKDAGYKIYENAEIVDMAHKEQKE